MPNNSLLEARINKALEWLEENPNLPFSQIDKAFNYHTSAASKWYAANTCGFRDKYDDILKRAFAALEAPAIAAMGDLVNERNFQACKYVLDNRGYKAADKIEANIQNEINITVEE